MGAAEPTQPVRRAPGRNARTGRETRYIPRRAGQGVAGLARDHDEQIEPAKVRCAVVDCPHEVYWISGVGRPRCREHR